MASRIPHVVILMALGAPVFAGCGLYLDFGNPAASSDLAARGAFATVRLFNCFGESREGPTVKGINVPFPKATATMSGTAEGIVSGHRVSVPLKIVKLANPGMSAVWWDAPKEGAWVLRLLVSNAGPYYIGGELQTVLGIVAAVGPNGLERRAQLLRTPPGAQEIDGALKGLPLARP